MTIDFGSFDFISICFVVCGAFVLTSLVLSVCVLSLAFFVASLIISLANESYQMHTRLQFHYHITKVYWRHFNSLEALFHFYVIVVVNSIRKWQIFVNF